MLWADANLQPGSPGLDLGAAGLPLLRDAQFRSLLTLETQVDKAKLRSLLHYSGLPISSSFIIEGVLDEVRPRPKRQEALVS